MAEAGATHWWYGSTRALLKQLLEPPLAELGRCRRLTVLDAGGGTGATGGWLSTRSTVVLADFEAMALEVARAEHDGLQPVRADLNSLPFGDAAFDAVLCVTALCHRMNPDPATIVADFSRIVRPGGFLCLMEPGGKRLWRGHDEVTHTGRRFSVGDLRSMAESAGLDVVKATGAYSFLVPPAALLGLIERGKKKSDVGRNQSGLGGALALLASAERRLLRSTSLPFGLSAVVLARKPAD